MYKASGTVRGWLPVGTPFGAQVLRLPSAFARTRPTASRATCMLASLVDSLLRWNSRRVLRRALEASAKGTWESFRLADLRTDEASSPTQLAKLSEALGVIRDADARRYRQLSKDIEWIAAAYHPYAHASYLQDVDAITIGSHILAHQDARVIASYLVHEGTHARIKSAGADQSGARAPRAERRCWLEQQSFVHRLPNADAVKDWIDGIVRSEPWSRHRSAESSVMAEKLSMLESSGMPDLAKRVLRWLMLLQQRSRA